MKTCLGIFLLLLLSSAARAQDATSDSRKGEWEVGVLAGGGTGLGKSSGTHFLFSGGRAGWILSREHLPGWLRGDFEWAVDALPVYTVFAAPREGIAGHAVYGGGFKPVVWAWNFTSHKKVVPYAAIEGGVLFTTQKVPLGNTSDVNFMPQVDFGVHIFSRDKQAILLEAGIVHHSNASLGRENPGYNSSFFWTIGYTWFK